MSEIKKILISGGAGFIGSHVADEFIRAGYSVRVMDHLGPPTHNREKPAWLHPQAELLVGDVRVKEDWRKALKGVDAVIHLAAYMDYHLDFSTYVRTNIESTTLLFECIVEDKLPIKKIVAASSQSVYGEGKYRCSTHDIVYPNPRSEERLRAHAWEQICPFCQKEVMPVPEEEDDILHPQIPYGISKLTSEWMLKNLGARYQVPVVMLRFSIALGARQSFRHFYSGALRAFSVAALTGQKMQIFEDGLQTRDFVHVEDVARAHRVVLEHADADFESFNVGSGVTTSVRDLAKIVAEEAGISFAPEEGKYRVGDARHQPMSHVKLAALGWKPQKTLRDAASDYLTWIRQFQKTELAEALRRTQEHLAQDGTIRS
ncbi:MAG TPA: NAD-dependent epimerase/dehydratase family protein [Patescibacteria group bacterium]|nr:NAD-dependent epimerase/dehydratase family protein [Patescibacteria group bacterium]